MIRNLFEEYKFFPKYPERQLKITAVLFGKILFGAFLSCKAVYDALSDYFNLILVGL